MSALGLLAVPAFLIGAGLADSPPTGRYGPTGAQAPGRAAVDQAPGTSHSVSPAGETRARDAAALTPTPAPGRTTERRPAGLRVEVVEPAGPLTADELVRFRVRWSDGNGRYAGLAEDWGDGTAASSVEIVDCTGRAGSHGGELSTAHRFPVGRYRVRLTVTTEDCDGRTEARTGDVTIDVRPPGEPGGRGRPPEPSAEADGSGPPVVPDEPTRTSAAPSPGITTPSSASALPLPPVESLGNP
ncbi:hypothetical protein [Cryptosporangium minutisporangium]|uniref:PKD domain-containing protein n=1 Tax=Cryptosporangium minutisporangium TaxID=113569 RepID=A0ABP6T7E0_9ACTN